MDDQAQGLRDLVKAGGFEAMGLPKVFDQSPDLDYKALYRQLRAEMETLARGRNLAGDSAHLQAFGATHESHMALWALDKMDQAETFARVKADLGAQR